MKLTPEALKAKANRLHLARQDMVEAGDYALSLEFFVSAKYLEWDLFGAENAIFIAVIVVYARPFVNSFSNGQADPKVVPEDLKLFDGENELEILHRRVIDLRNSALAHSDWTQHPTKLITDDKQYGLRREHSRPDYMEGIDLAQLRRLIEHVELAMRGLAYDLDVYYQAEVERHT